MFRIVTGLPPREEDDLTLYCDMTREGIDKAWMAQWRGAAVALAEQRVRELQALTEEDARVAILALLDLGASLPFPPEREHTSGLVVQQALFHRKHPPA